jgi:catechol 2,3-dioxygenase-like lactoylglutathione lyase family enzyme
MSGISENPGISGVAEIVLSVRDLPRMREFYRRVLGFALLSEARYETGPEPDEGGEPTICFLTIRQLDSPLGRHGHPQLLALIDYRRHVFARPRFVGHDPSRSTLNHLAFEIPPSTYEAHERRLTELGLEPRRSEFPDMSARALFFRDPEGNTLELICHHPESLDADTGAG